MSRFQGSLRMPGDVGPGVSVVVDLDAEKVAVSSPTEMIGSWPLADVGVRGEDDGFHLRIEGEEIVLSLDDESGFALAVGLQTASPRMRRRILAGLAG